MSGVVVMTHPFKITKIAAILLLLLFSPAAFSVGLCGEHKRFPYTDINLCRQNKWAPDEVCRTLFELQQRYSKTWATCRRGRMRMESGRRQHVMVQKQNLECLRAEHLQCLAEHGVDYCGPVEPE